MHTRNPAKKRVTGTYCDETLLCKGGYDKKKYDLRGQKDLTDFMTKTEKYFLKKLKSKQRQDKRSFDPL